MRSRDVRERDPRLSQSPSRRGGHVHPIATPTCHDVIVPPSGVKSHTPRRVYIGTPRTTGDVLVRAIPALIPGAPWPSHALIPARGMRPFPQVRAVAVGTAGPAHAARGRRPAPGIHPPAPNEKPRAHARGFSISAVAVGFEPTEELPPHTLSRRAPLAARTRHRRRGYRVIPLCSQSVRCAAVRPAEWTLLDGHTGVGRPGTTRGGPRRSRAGRRRTRPRAPRRRPRPVVQAASRTTSRIEPAAPAFGSQAPNTSRRHAGEHQAHRRTSCTAPASPRGCSRPAARYRAPRRPLAARGPRRAPSGRRCASRALCPRPDDGAGPARGRRRRPGRRPSAAAAAGLGERLPASRCVNGRRRDGGTPLSAAPRAGSRSRPSRRPRPGRPRGRRRCPRPACAGCGR